MSIVAPASPSTHCPPIRSPVWIDEVGTGSNLAMGQNWTDTTGASPFWMRSGILFEAFSHTSSIARLSA